MHLFLPVHKILICSQEFGVSFRPSEYRRVVEIQEKLRHKGLLKNLSKPVVRESPEGKQQAFDIRFAEALEILDGIVSSPLKHAEVLSGFTKEKDVKNADVLKRILHKCLLSLEILESMTNPQRYWSCGRDLLSWPVTNCTT